MRLTGAPPWVAGSASSANTRSCDSLSIIAFVVIRRAVRLAARFGPCGWHKTSGLAALHCASLAPAAIEEARHDPIAACAQAHPAQSCALEGISPGFGEARLRIR